MSKAREPEGTLDPIDRAKLHVPFDNIDLRYLKLALEVGGEEGWDFQLTDIQRVEAMWRVLDGDVTAYGFVAELREGRRVYFDYDNYDEDGIVERVTMQPMGDEPYPKLDGPIAGWEPAPAELNLRFAN
jgi:hypothetical protein